MARMKGNRIRQKPQPRREANVKGRPTRYNRYDWDGFAGVTKELDLGSFGKQVVKRSVLKISYQGRCPFCGCTDLRRHGVHWDGYDWVDCPIKVGKRNGKLITYMTKRRK